MRRLRFLTSDRLLGTRATLKASTCTDEVNMVRSEHLEKTLEDCSFSLLGRFHTTKLINFRAAKNLLRSVWKMGNDLKITDVGDGLFQFKFLMESQLKWVINNGP